eukprot:Sdes_comp20057_c0_seq1m12930
MQMKFTFWKMEKSLKREIIPCYYPYRILDIVCYGISNKRIIYEFFHDCLFHFDPRAFNQIPEFASQHIFPCFHSLLPQISSAKDIYLFNICKQMKLYENPVVFYRSILQFSFCLYTKFHPNFPPIRSAIILHLILLLM